MGIPNFDHAIMTDGKEFFMVIVIIGHGAYLKGLASISWSVDFSDTTLQIHYDLIA